MCSGMYCGSAHTIRSSAGASSTPSSVSDESSCGSACGACTGRVSSRSLLTGAGLPVPEGCVEDGCADHEPADEEEAQQEHCRQSEGAVRSLFVQGPRSEHVGRKELDE